MSIRELMKEGLRFVRRVSQRDRQIFHQVMVEMRSQRDVAREHNLSQSRVSRIVARVMAWMSETAPYGLEEVPRPQRLYAVARLYRDKLDYYEREAREAWERSKTEIPWTSTHDSVPGAGGKHELGPGKVVRRIPKPDLKYLDAAQRFAWMRTHFEGFQQDGSVSMSNDGRLYEVPEIMPEEELDSFIRTGELAKAEKQRREAEAAAKAAAQAPAAQGGRGGVGTPPPPKSWEEEQAEVRERERVAEGIMRACFAEEEAEEAVRRHRASAAAQNTGFMPQNTAQNDSSMMASNAGMTAKEEALPEENEEALPEEDESREPDESPAAMAETTEQEVAAAVTGAAATKQEEAVAAPQHQVSSPEARKVRSIPQNRAQNDWSMMASNAPQTGRRGSSDRAVPRGPTGERLSVGNGPAGRKSFQRRTPALSGEREYPAVPPGYIRQGSLCRPAMMRRPDLQPKDRRPGFVGNPPMWYQLSPDGTHWVPRG
jgi:hypothetical protein